MKLLKHILDNQCPTSRQIFSWLSHMQMECGKHPCNSDCRYWIDGCGIYEVYRNKYGYERPFSTPNNWGFKLSRFTPTEPPNLSFLTLISWDEEGVPTP